jgi:tRNA-dihydrouridine synthase B
MHWFKTGERRPDPTLGEQYRAIDAHYRDMLDHYGPDVGVKFARKHIGWYTKGLHGSAEFRNRANHEGDPEQVLQMLADFYGPWLEKAAA